MRKTSRSNLRVLTLAALLLSSGMPLASAQVDETPAGAIRAVRYHVEPGKTRVWFETTGPVLYTHYSPDPLTLVIDLPGVDISDISPRTVVGSREVESVVATRLEGTSGKSLSRIEIRLGTIVPYEISSSEQALNVFFDGGETPPPVSDDRAAGTGDAAPSPAPPQTAAAAEEPVSTAVSPAAGDNISTAPLPAPSRPASAIRGISHRVTDGVLAVTVSADGRLNYTSFRLDNPRRLVFDFNGVLNEVGNASVPIDAVGVDRARIAQYRSSPRITRLVFDLEGERAHRAIEKGSDLEIYFAADAGQLAALNPSLASMDETAADVDDASREKETPLNPVTEASTDRRASTTAVGTGAATPSGMAADGSAKLEPVALVAQSLPLTEVPVESSLLPAPAGPPALPEPPPPAQEVQPPVSTTPMFQTQTIGGEQKEYTGELISLDFKDGDIQDIFRLFADISGLNIVVQPGVQGRITLKLTEVPWDQALELILKTNKLGYVAEGNVIRIAPLSELAAEEADRRKLAEEKALAGELVGMTRVLSYAKAREVEPLLRRNLSARGDIVIDDRTNTVIVTDLQDRVDNIDTLINTLDTPIPGVEIEARIIVTTRNFQRELGIQWGFTGEKSQVLGNTTELTFPNSVLVSGQPIGSNVVEEFKSTGQDIGGGLLPPQIGADDAQRGYAVNLPFAGTPTGAIGISLGSITGAFSIDAALAAAERRGRARVISAPKIITQNNKQASIKQGVTFPVQVVANNTVTVQFKDAVLQLDVTPQITSAETIILDIVVNNDTIDFSQSVQGIPSIRTQSATTQVLVPDGSTTVIGGVFVNTDTTNERFVPLLHRIPILGNLFKSDSKTNNNQELLIFLTPRIRKDEA